MVMPVKPIFVTAAVIRNNGYILIAQRKNTSFLEPNKWEFPGGKIEKGERSEECLLREIKEELGVTITIERLCMVISHVYVKDRKNIPIVLIVYFASIQKGEVKPLDCQDAKWVHCEQLKNYDFVEGDVPIVDCLIHECFLQNKKI